VDVNDFVTLANAPLKNRPFNQRYRIRFSANVAEAGDMEFVNVPLDVFKKAALDQLTAGHPIWFACDCTQFALRKAGYLRLQTACASTSCSAPNSTGDKAHGLEYGDSPSNHAMTFTGVNLDEDGKPNRWKVENSWGKDAGKDGYYVMPPTPGSTAT
jgi:bleomycin hydrolase